MSNYAVINLKTDPATKRHAVRIAERLGISISAILNNELKRLIAEQRVTFEAPEQPNTQTAAALASSRKEIKKGAYHRFSDNQEALDFLARELK